MLERDRIIEIIAAVSAVLLMVGVMAGIGMNYTTGDTSLTTEGGELLVMAIVGFIALLLAVGIGLAFALNGPEDGLETEDDDADGGNAA